MPFPFYEDIPTPDKHEVSAKLKDETGCKKTLVNKTPYKPKTQALGVAIANN